MNQTAGMAVDSLGNVWSTNDSYNLTEISSAGVFLSGPDGYFSGAYSPNQIAVDLNDNAWVGANAHALFGPPGWLVELSSGGVILSGANGYGYGAIQTPFGLAIDGNNNVWVGDTKASNVVEVANFGQVLSVKVVSLVAESTVHTTLRSQHLAMLGLQITTFTMSANSPAPALLSVQPLGLRARALMEAGVLRSTIQVTPGWWRQAITRKCRNSPPRVTSCQGTVMSAGVLRPGMEVQSIAIDGDGNAWLPLYTGPGIVELSNAGLALSGNNGLQGGVAQFPNSLVIDGSGDVWVANDTLTISPVRGVPSVYTWRITEADRCRRSSGHTVGSSRKR